MSLRRWSVIAVAWIAACRPAATGSGGSGSQTEGFFTRSLDTADDLDQYCPAEKTLYYQWGPDKRVAAWLASVGYEPGGPAQPITAAMMQALLSTSDQGALLGAGLYLADNPFETVRYGNELLIFTVTKAPSSPACRWIPDSLIPQFVAATTSTGKVKLAEGLGPFAAYHPVGFGAVAKQPTYYILRRFPTSADKLNVTLGAAKSGDANIAWNEFFSTKPTVLRFMSGYTFSAVVDGLQATNDPNKAMNAGSKAFLWSFVANYLIPAAVERGLNKADEVNFAKMCTFVHSNLADSPGAKACTATAAVK